MSQIRIWNTTHLVVAAEQWTTTAAAWENAFTAVYQEVQLPGGRPWDGDAAQAALMRTHADRAKVLGAVDTLTGAAAIARGGAAEIDAARSRFSAGFRSLPGGDSQLYCGRDNFGFLHIANDHGRQWEDKTGAGPRTGN
jgi:hypothetical protein